MTRRIATLTTLLVLAFAAPAAAQARRLRPAARGAADRDAPRPQTAAVDDGETGQRTLFIILGALLVGFGVMGVLIPATRAAGRPRSSTAGPVVPEGTGARKPHTQAAKKKMRAKTRAQKQARKAHRR